MANTNAHKVENAMAAALTRFYEAYPQIDGLALDVIRNFAWDTFSSACTDSKINDPRFLTEAPEFAYRLLVRSALDTARALRVHAA